jgi:hypothetical protein
MFPIFFFTLSNINVIIVLMSLMHCLQVIFKFLRMKIMMMKPWLMIIYVVQMVIDVYQYFNENSDVNCDNRQATSMDEMNYINNYQKLFEDAKTPLYPSFTSISKLSTTVKLYNLKVKN